MEKGRCPCLKQKVLELKGNKVEAIRIGKGGAGYVYKGLYNNSNVAIKTFKIKNECMDIIKFKREVDIMLKVKHLNVVEFLDADTEPEPFIAMELANMGNLHEYINEKNPNWNTRLQIAIDVANGLLYLHKM